MSVHIRCSLLTIYSHLLVSWKILSQPQLVRIKSLKWFCTLCLWAKCKSRYFSFYTSLVKSSFSSCDKCFSKRGWIRHQKGRCTALIPANVLATAVRSQPLRLDCRGFASGEPSCKWQARLLDGKASPGNQHLTLGLPLARGHQEGVGWGWRWDKTWHKLVSRVYLSSYLWRRYNMQAGKTLLECSVLFKVKLERFLWRATRWVDWLHINRWRSHWIGHHLTITINEMILGEVEDF